MSKCTVVGEHWAGTRSRPTVKEQQELRPNRGVEPDNRGFGRRLRSMEFFGRGSGAMAAWRRGETQS